MGKIDVGRVLLGGLLSGLIINLGEFLLNEPILGERWKEAMESLNRPEPGGSAMLVFVVAGFLLGIAAVWVYAAIRPRFGPGPKTAIYAGLVVWFFCYFYVSLTLLPMGFFPTGLLLIGTVWGLFEIPIATLAGAWLYREEAA